MWPVSAAFRAAVTSSHTISTRFDVCRVDGQVLSTLDTVTSATMTDDLTQPVRRVLDIEFGSTDDLLGVDGLLAPGRFEIRPHRGVLFPDGTEELIPLGVFRTSQAAWRRSDGTVRVMAYDRSRTIRRNGLPSPYTIASGQDLATEVAQYLQWRWPECPALQSGVSESTTARLTWLPDVDAWQSVTELVAAHGCRLYFDALGAPVLEDIPDLATQDAVLTYTSDAAVITDVNGTLDDEESYGAVCVIGEAPGASPVSATVYDTDPGSATQWGGPLGNAVKIIRSTNVRTTAQAERAAAAQLPRWTGITQQLTWDQIVNPAQEAGDVVEMSDEATGLTGRWSLDAVTIPLQASGVMTARAKERRLWT